ncbi:MAG TPA: hypothetical protein VMT89_14185 [Candidatus Acidoferrales bacterium]|nr:hypothetical protein [Candidatus Acidoferrales bacterium]
MADLPGGFARTLVERMPLIYAEAHESVVSDPRFGEPEARYLHGHMRRALVESALREVATSFGVDVDMRRADGVGGPEHVALRIGRFRFTACHVDHITGFPRESRYRGQYSLINEHAAQVQLFPTPSSPGDAAIYGIVIHSETADDKARLGTLSIGFPNVACDDWLEAPIPIVDLADAQDRPAGPESGSGEPTPKWKRGAGKKASGE